MKGLYICTAQLSSHWSCAVSSVHDEQLGMEGYLRVLLQPLPRAWFHTFTKGLHLLVPPKSNWANPEGLGRAGSCAWWGDLVTH